MSLPVVLVAYGSDERTQSINRDVLGADADVVFTGLLSDAEKADAMGRARALISSSFGGDASARSLENAANLELLQLISAGVDHLDFSSVPSSVSVAGNVGAYAEPMAEHVLAMTLAMAKRLPQRDKALAEGRWEQHLLSRSIEGAVCALIGYGGIGQAVARLLRPFGARIWAVNTSGRTDDDVERVMTLGDVDEVLAAADVVVLALPLTKSTRGLIDKRRLERMKPNAILVNVARGQMIDQKALYEHLVANPDFCACIDAWWTEPLRDGEFRTDHPFFELPNFLGSPHNSAMVPDVIYVAERRAAENVRRYLRGEQPKGLVRREDYVG